MSTGAVAALSLILLLALIFFGVHLSTSLMFTSVLSVFLFTGRFSTAMNVLSQSAWGAVRQYMFGVIPLFVLMGLLANLSGASQDLLAVTTAMPRSSAIRAYVPAMGSSAGRQST